jgi:hypothetical protein
MLSGYPGYHVTHSERMAAGSGRKIGSEKVQYDRAVIIAAFITGLVMGRAVQKSRPRASQGFRNVSLDLRFSNESAPSGRRRNTRDGAGELAANRPGSASS